MAGRTVTGVMDRHRLFKGIESLNSVTTLQDGPSLARRVVTSGEIPPGRFSAKVFKGRFGLFMTNCMKLGGMFNNLFTWGLKEITLK